MSELTEHYQCPILSKQIKDLQEQLEQKDKESKKLQKKIHNQRVALRENWEITESRRKPWALKTMAKWHVENKELKARNEKLERAVEAVKEIAINSYECGHNDTVESSYCDAEDRTEEIIEEVWGQRIKESCDVDKC